MFCNIATEKTPHNTYRYKKINHKTTNLIVPIIIYIYLYFCSCCCKRKKRPKNSTFIGV